MKCVPLCGSLTIHSWVTGKSVLHIFLVLVVCWDKSWSQNVFLGYPRWQHMVAFPSLGAETLCPNSLHGGFLGFFPGIFYAYLSTPQLCSWDLLMLQNLLMSSYCTVMYFWTPPSNLTSFLKQSIDSDKEMTALQIHHTTSRNQNSSECTESTR